MIHRRKEKIKLHFSGNNLPKHICKTILVFVNIARDWFQTRTTGLFCFSRRCNVRPWRKTARSFELLVYRDSRTWIVSLFRSRETKGNNLDARQLRSSRGHLLFVPRRPSWAILRYIILIFTSPIRHLLTDRYCPTDIFKGMRRRTKNTWTIFETNYYNL